MLSLKKEIVINAIDLFKGEYFFQNKTDTFFYLYKTEDGNFKTSLGGEQKIFSIADFKVINDFSICFEFKFKKAGLNFRLQIEENFERISYFFIIDEDTEERKTVLFMQKNLGMK